MTAPNAVRAWEEELLLPTYPVEAADPNPMFLEKRVYQGSSGRVYPNPFTDRIATEKVDRSYRAIYLENDYVQLILLPEIGGRIFAALDKTNGYDFFYRQHVIKPALVGLLGPWISGGVEFNWPQHHRPSTFMPVHAEIEQAPDGSATVWLSEHDPMLRMKGMVGICLHPGRSLVEAKVRLYNRTPIAQTFLWWANVAVRVHDSYEAVFPPDVTFVADHAKRAVSHFPLAKNFYYGVDYTSGVDLRWYRNIPVPTSYMVTHSRYDFVGGYDHEKQAGFVHVADRHLAPGKKLWTWGSGEFGRAWDRNLTDSDGPYVELMAGVYTDNQPDFSWLQPYETRSFSQFWYPIQEIGPAACANLRAALSVQRKGEDLRLGVCSPEHLRDCSFEVRCGEEKVFTAKLDLAPGQSWIQTFQSSVDLEELRFELRDSEGTLLLGYKPERQQVFDLPEPATEPSSPEDVESTDELYITGLHLQQYRHATRSPDAYWEEGLRRDPGDARINNAVGLAALRRGEFSRAEGFFRAAIARLTRRNPNPYDGEPYYNLGLALRWLSRPHEAYEAFYKATWNGAWRGPAHFELAKIDSARGAFLEALDHLETSLAADAHNLKARDLRAALLRRLHREREARDLVEHTLRLDPLDFLALAENRLLTGEDSAEADREILQRLDGDVQTALDVAYDYADAGLLDDACRWLQLTASCTDTDHPMVFYTLGWLADQFGDADAERYRERAGAASPMYCFPSRLEEMVVLEQALRRNPHDAKASYYLGNFLYDRQRYPEAIACWRASVAVKPDFSIPWRNLGIAEFNIQHDSQAAFDAYAKAVEVNPSDARLLYEFDQLKKRLGFTPEERLSALEQHAELVEQRDDLSIERIALLNLTGQHELALSSLLHRRFSPWEGGEGLVSRQYVEAQVALGRQAMGAGDFTSAAEHFQAARHYPENLGEGKHLLTLERQIDYWEGLARERCGETMHARELYTAAAAALPRQSIHAYYRALAFRRLGREEDAHTALEQLRAYAQQHRDDEPTIEYFATSLPNFLLFEDDLKRRNLLDCLVLEAYAELGLGHTQRAQQIIADVMQLDPSNAEVRQAMAQFGKTPLMREDAHA